VFRKEVLEVVRDYKNLLVMAFVPIVFLQVLVAGTQVVVDRSITRIERQRFSISIFGDDAGNALRDALAKIDPSITFLPAQKSTADGSVHNGTVDLAIQLGPDFWPSIHEMNATPDVQVIYDARHNNAIFAFARVSKALAMLQSELRNERIKRSSLEIPPLPKLQFHEEGAAAPASAYNMSRILPMMLLLVITITLLSPSIDLFTGENERGTMPLLMVSPVETRDVVLAKLSVVCLFGQTAVTLGLLSFFTMISVLSHRKDRILSFVGVSTESLLLLFFLTIPLVIILSSLSVLLASKCKSFQQAQGYYLPFMIAVMAPLSVINIHDTRLLSVFSFLPIGNILLAMREVIVGTKDWLGLGLVYLVACAYAFATARFTMRSFDRLEQMDRAQLPREARHRAGDYVPEVTVLLSVSFLLMFYAGQILQAWNALLGTVWSQLLAVLLPGLMAVKFLRLPFKKTLSLNMPSWRLMTAAAMLSPAVALLSIAVSHVQSLVLPVPEGFSKTFLEMIMPAGRSLPVALLVFAVLPGVCEELLFRGAVLGLLRRKLSSKMLILTVGVIFGAFHLSSYRFLSTACLGVAVTALTVWSGSIFPAMVLHACHNALLLGAQVCNLKEPTIALGASIGLATVAGLVLIWTEVRRFKSLGKP
jgi:sodium transport system permease protein